MKHIKSISFPTPKLAMQPQTLQQKKCVKKGSGGCFPEEM